MFYDAHNKLVFAADIKGMGIWQGVAIRLYLYAFP
jgi:hypothetical protein